ncbi:hydrogenase [Desulforhopalus singaporensis]|uniref:Hydrogenase-4 component E n=1 Tax=Desulforhopalus singaporensis TaxID=91360 RepID=A0A1H0SC43_9BACT|nr:hydrogenase [Desulforhopalus singaporensis]SDP39079.1 hydrogenase-4 component E [Desulforhopalus singaporensis]
MINFADFILVLILLSVLLSLGSTRLMALVKIMALQGVMVSVTPLFLNSHEIPDGGAALFYLVMIFIKGALIPVLLYWAVKRVSIKREIEPIVGYHASIVTGLAVLLGSVFIVNSLHLSLPEGRSFALITANSTLAAGFFLMMARRKAITQVIGYLMLENGIYLIGTALTKRSHTIYIVEFGVLLDLLVGVMIMGIILNNINTAFDDIDTTLLGQLKD